MFFIFFCLIFRTAYQGVLFEFMTKEMRKKLPTTIEELYVKNYSIYVDVDKFYSNPKILVDKLPEHIFQNILGIKITSNISPNEYEIYFYENIRNDSRRLAFYMGENSALPFLFRNRIFAYRLEQKVFSSTLGMGQSKNHFLFFLYDKIIQDLTSTGVMLKFWKDNYGSDKLAPDEGGPQVLGIGDLEFGFVFWLSTLILPITVFALEIFSFHFLRKIKFFLVRKVKNFVGKFLILRFLRDLYLN